MFIYQMKWAATAQERNQTESDMNIQIKKGLIDIAAKAVENKTITPQQGNEIQQKINNAKTNQDLHDIALDMRDKYGIKNSLLDTLIKQLSDQLKKSGAAQGDPGTDVEQTKISDRLADRWQDEEEKKAERIVNKMDPHGKDGGFFSYG